MNKQLFIIHNVNTANCFKFEMKMIPDSLSKMYLSFRLFNLAIRSLYSKSYIAHMQKLGNKMLTCCNYNYVRCINICSFKLKIDTDCNYVHLSYVCTCMYLHTYVNYMYIVYYDIL